jgi:predicted site-specific integrase-resolvase
VFPLKYCSVGTEKEFKKQIELQLTDIITLLHVFSCKLYGLRKYRKQIEGDEEIAKELQNGNKSK